MCNDPNVPSRLHTGGRAAQEFDDSSEILFRHFLPNEQNEIRSDSIDVRKTSMNRGKFMDEISDSFYALKDYSEKDKLKIFGITVGKIRDLEIEVEESKSNSPKRLFRFNPVHDPTPCMYPHTLIVPVENSTPLHEIRPSSVKARYRSYIINHSQIY
ncbi:hypothetical protein [Leptospira bandrabouensis]|uniref:Uncharacterized protein n=1 Tax=Leptospira bandrabouensis TaxID=2484903 RepID=A0A6H3NP47_9LEPT|nr:hypothetical protein [Leptospira bandrabouensis]TGN13487.1 hypothetical protein EHR08_11565 [Leptospira bandrabouensis]